MFEETRNALAAFMKESQKSQRQLSKETGLSTSVISQFLNGTYPGDNEDVAKTIEQYLSVGKERLISVSEARFYEGLYNTREVLFACNYAHRNNDITLVSGDAGAGKTTALRHYADTNTGVIFVTANACITTATAILSLICRKIGRQIPARRAALMNTLVEQLSGTNRLIIIDEATTFHWTRCKQSDTLTTKRIAASYFPAMTRFTVRCYPRAGDMNSTRSEHALLYARKFSTNIPLKK